MEYELKVMQNANVDMWKKWRQPPNHLKGLLQCANLKEDFRKEGLNFVFRKSFRNNWKLRKLV